MTKKKPKKPAPTPRTPEDAAKRREADADREVRRLHREVENIAKLLLGANRLSGEGVDLGPDAAARGKAGDLLLAVAKQKADVAGLSARHTRKVEAKVTPSSDVDSWFEGLAKK